mmetsp:Transcript_6188/g.11033  ORF Transcript_6188/g.11033 Transcript_6188/m.11033 type:complete len:451 (-) Transcript_6188:992-2344(-)
MMTSKNALSDTVPNWVVRAVLLLSGGGHSFSCIANDLGWKGVFEYHCIPDTIHSLLDELSNEEHSLSGTICDFNNFDIFDIFVAFGHYIHTHWITAIPLQTRIELILAVESTFDRVSNIISILSKLTKLQFNILSTIITHMTKTNHQLFSRNNSNSLQTLSSSNSFHSNTNNYQSSGYVCSPLLLNMFDRAVLTNAAVFGPLLFCNDNDDPLVVVVDDVEENKAENDDVELYEVIDSSRAENALCVLVNLWHEILQIRAEKSKLMKEKAEENALENDQEKQELSECDNEKETSGSENVNSIKQEFMNKTQELEERMNEMGNLYGFWIELILSEVQQRSNSNVEIIQKLQKRIDELEKAHISSTLAEVSNTKNIRNPSISPKNSKLSSSSHDALFEMFQKHVAIQQLSSERITNDYRINTNNNIRIFLNGHWVPLHHNSDTRTSYTNLYTS